MDHGALEAAKELAGGDAKFILAAAVLLLIGLATWLGRSLYAEMKDCNSQMLALVEKKIESDNKLAAALEGLERVVEAKR